MKVKFIPEQSERKERGAFFTPEPIARFMVDWAIRLPSDRVLEPSCGEAAFLRPAAQRLKALGAHAKDICPQLHGFDIHQESIAAAKQVLKEIDVDAHIAEGDFLGEMPHGDFDSVVGNPPFVRYQSFSGEARARGLQAALRQGVRLTQLSSSWAAFVIHSAAFLKSEGRLALVLPAELLTVNYASQVRRYLLQRFRSVRLVLFESLVFPGVLTEVVLLLAEGSGGATNFEVFQAKNLEDLKSTSAGWTGFTPSGDEKWTTALLESRAVDDYQTLLSSGHFVRMAEWGGAYLGAVTGNNSFFTLTAADVKKAGLSSSEVLRISPPGSRHLRGLTFSEAGWKSLVEDGQRGYLFSPSPEPSRAALRYIQFGEKEEVNEAYKCQVREPWWQVPLVAKPDFLFAYMNHDRPRLVRNGANVQLLNSLYGVRIKPKHRKLALGLLPIASLNSMTLLGGELVGRSYGGGILKHEPREADSLPMPSPAVLKSVAKKLDLLGAQIAVLLRRNDISAAIDIVDRTILTEHLGLEEKALSTLRDARNFLFQRRTQRGKGINVAN